ncbi:MAG TPA: NTP transferase domain-containing protein [Labilithrix sp.]|jgi:molybdopterin-guanine dinucleotide biosynthesis protein A|nr:NTP transferase domain-containing protein [Labilithrix sp.]
MRRSAPVLGGIFVGGKASRMGGVAKGLLLAPDGERIVLRTRKLFADVGLPCVLVGAHPAYRDLGIEVLADDPAAAGPLGGILALLDRAGQAGLASAIAIACDMPFVDRELLRRLVDAPPAPVVAPRRRDHERERDVWEPLFARYDVSISPAARAFASAGKGKLQVLLDLVGAEALALGPAEEATLADWDFLPLDETRGSRGT